MLEPFRYPFTPHTPQGELDRSPQNLTYRKESLRDCLPPIVILNLTLHGSLTALLHATCLTHIPYHVFLSQVSKYNTIITDFPDFNTEPSIALSEFYRLIHYSLEDFGIYACSNAECTNLSCDTEFMIKTYVCGGCMEARYCSRDCQAASWRAGHKLYCKNRQTLELT